MNSMKRNILKLITMTVLAAGSVACGENKAEEETTEFKYLIDEFADLQILRYQIPGWDELSLKQKEYVYHLSEAAKWGRDIIWDQNCKCNLEVRHALEAIIEKQKNPGGSDNGNGRKRHKVTGGSASPRRGGLFGKAFYL